MISSQAKYKQNLKMVINGTVQKKKSTSKQMEDHKHKRHSENLKALHISIDCQISTFFIHKLFQFAWFEIQKPYSHCDLPYILCLLGLRIKMWLSKYMEKLLINEQNCVEHSNLNPNTVNASQNENQKDNS